MNVRTQASKQIDMYYVPDDSLSLGDVVALLVGSRVSVRVRDSGETGVDVVGLGGSHQIYNEF